jgi:hypothetical protein
MHKNKQIMFVTYRTIQGQYATLHPYMNQVIGNTKVLLTRVRSETFMEPWQTERTIKIYQK